VRVREGRAGVERVEDRWRIDDEWWREEPVCRLYYKLLLEGGGHITVFRDLTGDRWYEQRYA